jgi:hypothetical protein
MRAIVVAMLVITLTSCHKERPRLKGPRPKLELVVVDDEGDPTNAIDTARLPTGAALMTETVDGKSVHYARIVPQPGRLLGDSAKSLDTFLQSQALPPGDRFCVGPFSTEGGPDDAIRSYVLKGSAVVTEANVVDASSAKDPVTARYSVAVALDAAGAMNLESVTGANVGRRLAIVVDGSVLTAPVVRSKISGGHLQITLGVFASPQAEKDEADRLAHGFSGR